MGAIADQAANGGEKPKSTQLVLKETVGAMMPVFQQVVPAGMSADRMNGIVYSAVRTNPGLVACLATPKGKASLMSAAIEAATLGLDPNTPLHLATIVPRKKKEKTDKGQWIEYQAAQLMIEYRGFVTLMKRSGDVKAIRAGVVRSGDLFDYDLGTGHVSHKLSEDDRPGELTHVWAKAVHPDGEETLVVLPKRVVLGQHRAKSDSYRYGPDKSPWTTDEEAMWLKTALRVLSKMVVMTAEVARSFAMVEPAELALAGDGDVLSVVDDSEIVDAEIVG